jgi:hypothetical protein
LPACLNSTGRCEDVIKTVPLIKLRALDRRIVRVTIKNHHALIEQFGSVFAHATDHKKALDTGAAARECANQICLAIVIPERTRIDPALSLFDQKGLGPGTGRVLRLYEVNAEIGVRIKDVELAVVIADGRRPNAVSVLRAIKDIEGRLA